MKSCLVIFGVTGDLSKRKLLPALAKLYSSDFLDEDFKIVGVTRRDISVESLMEQTNEDTVSGSAMNRRIEIIKMDLDQQSDYLSLKRYLDKAGFDRRLFYLSVPPFAVKAIIGHLGIAGLNDDKVRLLVEKPFGVDYESSKELIEFTSNHFSELQVYRIDHYLAKEMVQNILVFRGSNALFSRTWNSDFIDRIEITASENIGVGWRAEFYEHTGAMTDIIQSHLLQLLAVTIMELPDNMESGKLLSLRLAALESLKLPPADLFGEYISRAQYEGYGEEVGNPGTTTETFASLTVFSEMKAWKGVPIKLTTGKNLRDKSTTIRVFFKEGRNGQADCLTLRIQPEEGIEIDLWVKKPGYDKALQKAVLDFSYESLEDDLTEAYEQVLIDAIRGDKGLFASREEVLASWRLLEPVQSHWRMNVSDMKTYKKGTPVEDVP